MITQFLFIINQRQYCQSNDGLNNSEIMEIIYLWTADSHLSQVEEFTGGSRVTICHWMNLCRNIPEYFFKRMQTFGGPNKIIKIDTCLLNVIGNNNNKDHNATWKFKSALREEKVKKILTITARELMGLWLLVSVLSKKIISLDIRFFIDEKRDKINNLLYSMKRLFFKVTNLLQELAC